MSKVLSILCKSTKYIWSISPVGVLVYLGLIVLQGAIPGLLVFYTKSIVDFLIAGAAERSGAMTRFIVWWIALVFLRAAMGSFLMLVYEDSAFYDTMNVLWQGSGSRPVNFLLNTSITIRNLVLLSNRYTKDHLLFGLGGFIIGKYRELYGAIHEQKGALRRRNIARSVPSSVVYVGVIGFVLMRLLN